MALVFVGSLLENTSRISRTVIKAMELLLLSAGLISALAMVKGAVVPYFHDIVISGSMAFCNFIKCFFSSSLYIWIIINFIFMLIATSSLIFRHRQNEGQEDEIMVLFDHEALDPQIDESPVVSPPPAPPPLPLPSAPPLPSPKDVTEVSEEEDTLDATWKAITGGEKEKPERKHLKKSETWDVPPRRRAGEVRRLDSEEVVPSSPKWRELRKSETFNDAVSLTRRGGLRRGHSMSVDEFNKKVEAFIKKFNDNMRLQRQESEQRFLDMIGRGR